MKHEDGVATKRARRSNDSLSVLADVASRASLNSSLVVVKTEPTESGSGSFANADNNSLLVRRDRSNDDVIELIGGDGAMPVECAPPGSLESAGAFFFEFFAFFLLRFSICVCGCGCGCGCGFCCALFVLLCCFLDAFVLFGWVCHCCVSETFDYP